MAVPSSVLHCFCFLSCSPAALRCYFRCAASPGGPDKAQTCAIVSYCIVHKLVRERTSDVFNKLVPALLTLYVIVERCTCISASYIERCYLTHLSGVNIAPTSCV